MYIGFKKSISKDILAIIKPKRLWGILNLIKYMSSNLWKMNIKQEKNYIET
jgi:hypothetical protein